MAKLKNSEKIKLLDNLLHGITKGKGEKQAIIAVESYDKSFSWTGTAGRTTSGEPVAGNTPYFIASIDKLYNAVITMMLIESGKLKIDDPICTYLPESITKGLHYHKGIDRTGEITIKHLLTHTSGLADWFEDYPRGCPSLAEELFKEGDRKLTIEDLASHVRDRLKPHFLPQDLAARHQKVRYSDTNFILIAEIIEAVTGLPLHEVHKKMLHEPLDLHQTFFAGRIKPSELTSPMILRANGEPLHIPLIIESIKGIYSTVSDMIKFMRCLMAGKLFSDQNTQVSMMTNWNRFGFPMDRASLRSPNWPIEYGTGLMRFRVPRVFTPLTSIPAVVGHTGSTGCWLFYCSELDLFTSGTFEDAAAGPLPFRLMPKMLKILLK